MTNLEFAQGLRALADLYERHPEMLVPDHRLFLYLPYSEQPARYAETIKALADGGTVTKAPPKPDDWYLRVNRQFSALSVDLSIERSALCKRVVKMQAVETWECPDSLIEALGESNAETT